MAIDSLYEMVKWKLHGSLNLHELFSKSDQFGTGSPREFGVDVPFQRRLAGDATVGLLAWRLCEWVQGVRGLMEEGVDGVFVMASDRCIFSASRRLIVSHHGTETRG